MSPVQRPTREQVAVFPSAAEFRAWLDANHDTAPELFVGYYRKGSGKSAMTYAESVEEALCYGWIDGITFRVDDEVTATRFTPRRRTLELERAERREGRGADEGRPHAPGRHARLRGARPAQERRIASRAFRRIEQRPTTLGCAR